jgi:hypothetical protein
MRDDVGDPVRVRFGALALAVALAAAPAAPARGETFHGSAEVQYQNLDRAQFGPDQDTWNKIFQLDYGNLLPGAISLTSSVRFVEQTIARQPDRVRVPEGSLRLAHRNFGISTSYRPSETRDARSIVTRQQDLNVTAYARQEKLPQISGSWVRTHLDPSGLAPGTATVTRSLAAQYAIPHATFRAGYGDRGLEDGAAATPRQSENHLSLGSSSQFQIGRAPLSLVYDFSRARARGSLDRSQVAQAHLAGLTSSFALSPKATTSLSYNYRNTRLLGIARGTQQEHNGTAAVSYLFNPVVSLSGGGGVRDAQLGGGRNLTDRYVAATLTAQGQARPGWRMSAAATHSVNWLPDAAARPSENLQTATTMRIARGLDLRGDFSIATAKPVIVPPETTAFPRQVSVQSGVGVIASPLRTFSLDASVSKSRAGTRLTSGGVSATSYSTGIRVSPSSAFQMTGRWGVTDSPGARATTGQASVQWTLTGAFQLSGSWTRAEQEVFFLNPRARSLQESLSGSLSIRLAEDLNGAVQYSEANRGRPNQIRQLLVHLVRRFGR